MPARGKVETHGEDIPLRASARSTDLESAIARFQGQSKSSEDVSRFFLLTISQQSDLALAISLR
jgi:hypothetical protein